MKTIHRILLLLLLLSVCITTTNAQGFYLYKDGNIIDIISAKDYDSFVVIDENRDMSIAIEVKSIMMSNNKVHLTYEVTLGDAIDKAMIRICPTPTDTSGVFTSITSGTYSTTFDAPEDLNVTGSITLKYSAPYSEEKTYTKYFDYYTPWCSTLSDWVASGYESVDFPMTDGNGTCNYTYTQFFSGVDENLTIHYRQSLSDPTQGQFWIEHWGYDIDLYINYNTSNHNCVVKDQYTGYEHTNYGPVDVMDISEWQGQDYYANYPCTYNPETGKFLLNVVYRVAAGHFGYGEEYIQVNGY